MITPATIQISLGGSGSVTVTTTLIGTSAPQQLVMTASGVPSGVSYTFSPPSINSGQSTNLTFSVATTATPSTYPITITATGTLTTHTNTLSLVVATSDFNV
jgi:uncharacterized membrane protein